MGSVRWGCVIRMVASKIGEGVALVICAILIGVIFIGIPMGLFEGLIYLRSLEIPWVNALVGGLLLVVFLVLCILILRDVVRFFRRTIDSCRVE